MRSTPIRRGFGPAALLALAFLLVASSAHAQVPDPNASTFGFGQPPCGPGMWYVFTPAQGTLTVTGTLRDIGGNPVAGHPVTVNILPTSGTLSPCGFGTHSKTVTTNTDGDFSITFGWRDMAGYGGFDIDVVVQGSSFRLFPGNRSTSPDLDASGWVDIVDMGILASGMPPFPGAPPAWFIDYNCDGAFSILDIGIWASGLGIIC